MPYGYVFLTRLYIISSSLFQAESGRVFDFYLLSKVAKGQRLTDEFAVAGFNFG